MKLPPAALAGRETGVAPGMVIPTVRAFRRIAATRTYPLSFVKNWASAVNPHGEHMGPVP